MFIPAIYLITGNIQTEDTFLSSDIISAEGMAEGTDVLLQKAQNIVA
jgi:hypothetical protein